LNYHVILTDECNLCCSYCRGRVGNDGENAAEVLLDDEVPIELSYSLDTLAGFLARDAHPSVTFYGGEPLLRPDLVTAIMDRIPAATYLLHTNGVLLDQLPDSAIHRIHAISVSLDGPEEVTDRNRGVGVYRRVLQNLQALQRRGFAGELIARMTVPVGTDIYHMVRYLFRNADHSFSSLHWQLDADFSGEGEQEEIRSWIEEQYNPGIRALIRDWVEEMRQTGSVWRWYPFIDPFQDMLLGRNSLLRCGCGHASYGILTNGAIVPCPLMVGMKEYYAGHIASAHPCDLPTYPIGGRCTACQIRDFCGGRCLYANLMGHWSEERKDLVCRTVQTLHDGLQEVLPEVRTLLERGVIRYSDFDHPRFEGCEIIP
jgi:uncharacterized protein